MTDFKEMDVLYHAQLDPVRMNKDNQAGALSFAFDLLKANQPDMSGCSVFLIVVKNKASA